MNRTIAPLAMTALLLTGCAGTVETEPAPEPATTSTTPAPERTTATPTPEAASDCLEVSPELAAAIASGATDPNDFIPGNAAAYLSPNHGEVYLVAMEFSSAGTEDNVGVWATNSLDAGSGLILSADGFANEFTTWPDAMTTDAEINAASEGVQEAKDCLG